MMDAVSILLHDKKHVTAQKLNAFHYANEKFLPRMVAEIRWLKRLGRTRAGAKALIHYLRWDHDWQPIDEFEINDHLSPIAMRVCVLLWPDINGIMRFRHCEADEILGTWIENGGKRFGNFLYPGEHTLSEGFSFLPPQNNGHGQVRPIFSVGTTLPPEVPLVDRAPTFHLPITESEAALIVAPLHDIVGSAPNPQHPLLRAWLAHIEAQPEVFAFLKRTLLQRERKPFSANSLLEYARHSIRRAAASHKRFTVPNDYGALYSRALILLNPQFNGLCEFRAASNDALSNEILGCTLAPERIEDEPYRRLLRIAIK